MRFLTLLFLLVTITVQAQQLTGEQLLDKAIEHHDPNGHWSQFVGDLQVTMKTPDQSERVSDISINLPTQTFELITMRDSVMTESRVVGKEVTVVKVDLKNLNKKFETTDKEWDRAVLMKNYYTYLYGLPMKLKDPGTIITDQIEHKTFKGKEYLVLEVMYDENVGSDVWYFYFDPTTYKMEIYQFYKKDKNGAIDKNSGEYILLTENHQVNEINMPRVRQWYYNKDDQFLGTDVITK
ncbi:MAG: DUF6503 family protein [Nonlabens sp.]|uniref:DUF6503 family protein n=1 Tax=Nonlabens sp. TaxID=1888209 RepID=UPI003EF7D587